MRGSKVGLKWEKLGIPIGMGTWVVVVGPNETGVVSLEHSPTIYTSLTPFTNVTGPLLVGSSSSSWGKLGVVQHLNNRRGMRLHNETIANEDNTRLAVMTHQGFGGRSASM